MKFIHVTDPHLVEPGGLLHTLDPLERFRACMRSINERDRDAECVVITGDLADRGQPEAYQAFRQVLDEFSLPCHLLLGNHDNRESFLSVFREVFVDANGFIQGGLETSRGRFLFLDTLHPGQSAGSYCDLRCSWLESELAAAGSLPVYLFMHHPPFAVNIPFLDNIGLGDPQGFIDAVDGRDNIRHLFFGHVHRPISGSWRGIPFSTLSSTNHQVALNLESTEKINYRDEPPSYNIVFLNEDSTIVHTCPFMDSRVLAVENT